MELPLRSNYQHKIMGLHYYYSVGLFEFSKFDTYNASAKSVSPILYNESFLKSLRRTIFIFTWDIAQEITQSKAIVEYFILEYVKKINTYIYYSYPRSRLDSLTF